jgi:hypothetical protein
VGAFTCPPALADRSSSRQLAGEASGQTSPGEHDPDHRSEEFLYELKPALRAAALPATVLGRQAP